MEQSSVFPHEMGNCQASLNLDFPFGKGRLRPEDL